MMSLSWAYAVRNLAVKLDAGLEEHVFMMRMMRIMMKKCIFGMFVWAVAGIFFSCASAPPPEAPAEEVRETVNFETAKARAVAARDKAREIKADVSLTDRYHAVEGIFAQAETLEASQSPQGIDKYLEAEKGFLECYEQARALREEAQRQLSRAREAIKEVEAEAAELSREQEAEHGGRVP
jgi:hypothetical protein